MTLSDKKHLYWVIGLVIIVLILCITIIWLNYNAWTLRLEMDNNTLEAIKSINFTEIIKEQNKIFGEFE